MKKRSVILACFILFGAFRSFTMTLIPAAGAELKDTVKARVNSWISIRLVYEGKTKGKDTLLYDSKEFMKGNPLLIQLPPPDFDGDLFSRLAGMMKGDSITFQVNADSLFMRTFRAPQKPAFLDSAALITIHVRLFEIETPEGMKKNEEVRLDKYLADNNIDALPWESGIYVIEHQKGTGVKIDSGCMIRMNVKISLIDGKQLFNSAERPEPIKFRYGKQFDTPGINEAIGKMSGGTKATVIVPSDKAWGEAGKGALIPPFSTMIYDLDILDVQSKDDYDKEQIRKKFVESIKKDSLRQASAESLKKYIADQKITAKPTSSGLYYIEKVAGKGDQPAAGDKVKVHYTGTTLNGKKFDSSVDRNQPFEFTIGKGQVIKGWDEGIAMMKKGGKATLIIPFNIAYGERSMGNDIPAFATLVYEVELLDVTKPVKE